MASMTVASSPRQRFPSELVFYIAEQLFLTGDKAALSRFAQVSKQWKPIVSQYLWREVPLMAIIWCGLVNAYWTYGAGFSDAVATGCGFFCRRRYYGCPYIYVDHVVLEIASTLRRKPTTGLARNSAVIRLQPDYSRFFHLYAKYIRAVDVDLRSLVGIVRHVDPGKLPSPLTNIASLHLTWTPGPPMRFFDQCSEVEKLSAFDLLEHLYGSYINARLTTLSAKFNDGHFKSPLVFDFLDNVVKLCPELAVLQLDTAFPNDPALDLRVCDILVEMAVLRTVKISRQACDDVMPWTREMLTEWADEGSLELIWPQGPVPREEHERQGEEYDDDDDYEEEEEEEKEEVEEEEEVEEVEEEHDDHENENEDDEAQAEKD